jgi:uncharacterized membrane protein YqjE
VSERPPLGLMASLRRLLGGSAELIGVRVELLGTELQREKLRLLESFAWLALALIGVAVAVALLTILIVLEAGERHRSAAVGVLSLAYLAGAWWAWRTARARLSAGEPPFAATRAELRRDVESLRGDTTAPPAE